MLEQVKPYILCLRIFIVVSYTAVLRFNLRKFHFEPINSAQLNHAQIDFMKPTSTEQWVFYILLNEDYKSF